MRLHVIGLGGAGARIVDRLSADYDDRSFLDATLVCDTDQNTLDTLESIPEKDRYRFADRANGTGLGGDLQTGFDIGEEHADELSRIVDTLNPSRAEAFLLVVGLGGATGGGVAPALTRNVRRLHDVPVYVLGTLPSVRGAGGPEHAVSSHRRGTGNDGDGEPQDDPRDVTRGGPRDAPRDEPRDETDAWHDGDNPIPDPMRPLAGESAASALDRLDGLANAIVAFDNDLWLRRDERLDDALDRLNGVIASRTAALFGAGDTAREGSTPQQVVDASDVNRALGDRSNIATIGHATQSIERPETGSRFGLGLFSRREPQTVDPSEAVSVVETVIRKAARGTGTVETNDGRADRTLLIVGGPPEWLNRDAIAQGRRWLARETGSDALLSGDAPDPQAESVHAIVLRAGIEPTDRLTALRQRRA